MTLAGLVTTPDKIRSLLSEADIGQREAARLLKLRRVKVNEREFRNYCTGKIQCPEATYLALQDLVNEIANTR